MKKGDKIILKNYQALCRTTAKKFKNRNTELVNWGLGVSGEAGDLAGCIKKTVFHGNNQVLGIRENIGDTMWYIAMICNCLGWNLEDVLSENIIKLRDRYPRGFNEGSARRNNSRIDWNAKE